MTPDVCEISHIEATKYEAAYESTFFFRNKDHYVDYNRLIREKCNVCFYKSKNE